MYYEFGDEEGEEMFNSKKKRQPAAKNEEVQDVLEILKNKHKSGFTPMRLCIWAEMIGGGLHSSKDDPPQTSMFSRGGEKSAIQKSSSQVTNLVAEAATAITSALTCDTSYTSHAIATGNVIENRSKLYSQLSELHTLYNAGILTESEYAAEKQIECYGDVTKVKEYPFKYFLAMPIIGHANLNAILAINSSQLFTIA